MKRDGGLDVMEIIGKVERPSVDDSSLQAARATGAYINHKLNNNLQAVLYRAEMLREHDDPQVAEAGKFLAECARAMADTVRMVRSLRKFVTVPYCGMEPMLDPCEEDESWSA